MPKIQPVMRPWKPGFLSHTEWKILKWTVFGFVVTIFGVAFIVATI